MLPLAIASGALGLFQTLEGLSGLKKMPDKPLDELSPEEQNSYALAEQKRNVGFTGEQHAALEQDRSRGENTAFHRAYDASQGNQGGAINAALKSMDLLSRNKEAFQGAQLAEQHGRYADTRGDKITTDRQRISGEKRHDWDQRAQAYGGAMQTGLTNLTNMFNLNQALGAYKDAAAAGGDHNAIMAEVTRAAKTAYMNTKDPVDNFAGNAVADQLQNTETVSADDNSSDGFDPNDIYGNLSKAYGKNYNPLKPE